MLDDEALLRNWQAKRDPEAFRTLVLRHSAMVYATARRILGDASHAEDVAQECFLALSTAALPQRSKLHLAGWLHRVATRRALSLLRREKREKRLADEWAQRRDGRDVEWKDVEAWVDRAIEELPDKLRFAIVAHFLEGRSHRAIARELGVSREAVTYRIKVGTEKIRERLRRQGFTTSAALLAGWLSTRTVEALPSGLGASLATMGLAGAGSEARGVTAGAAGAVFAIGGLMKGIRFAVAAVLLITGAFLVYRTRDDRKNAVAPDTAVSGLTAGSGLPAPVAVAPTASEEGSALAPPDMEPVLTCSISGVVEDPDGKPVPFAAVSLVVHPQVASEGTAEQVLEWVNRKLKEDYLQRSRWFTTEPAPNAGARARGRSPRRRTP